MPLNHRSYSTNKLDVVDMLLTHRNRTFTIKKIESLKEEGSDHFPIKIVVGNTNINKKENKIKMYHKINRPQLGNILEKRNKGKVFTISEIDEKIENLHKLLHEIDNTIPYKNVPTNNLGLNKNTR